MRMEIFFKKISEQYGDTLNIDESTWYNGHAYMPLLTYTLEFNENNLKVNFKYEFRKSEFKSSTSIDGGTFGDRHIFEVTAFYKNISYDKFSVVETYNIFQLFSKNKTRYKLKSKEDKIINNESINRSLDQIYQYVDIDPEFSPNIYGKPLDNDYEIIITFNTKIPHIKLVEEILAFLLSFDIV